MALSSLGTFKKKTTTKFSIKSVFKNFDVEFLKSVVPLTFSPTAPAEPTPPGGPCAPCGCKQESLNEEKF